MEKEGYTWYLFGGYCVLAIIILIFSSIFLNINYEGKVKIIEVILSSSSISIGFFGTIFTFVFGSKENNIYQIIMRKDKSKSQFKFLNKVVFILGFLIILLCVIMIVILYSKEINSAKLTNFFTLLIFSLQVLYFLFFSTYLFIMAKLVFQDVEKIKHVQPSKIKENVAEKKLEKIKETTKKRQKNDNR